VVYLAVLSCTFVSIVLICMLTEQKLGRVHDACKRCLQAFGLLH
jgi:hypothetical protein